MSLLTPADKCEIGFIKAGFYGGPGSGKTFSMLKIATALGKTALIDVERGAEPYKRLFKCPDGSPFLICETRYIDEAEQALEEALDAKCDCIIVDQLTGFWESAQELYIAQEHEKMSKVWETVEKNGTLPWQSWRMIKRPFKKFLKRLIDCPAHVFFAGRMSVDYERGPDGEPRKVGERINCEKDTGYEPQILVKMEGNLKKKEWRAYVEKDRWSVIGGEIFVNPTVEMFRPILNILGNVHAPTPSGPEDVATGTIADIKANKGQLQLVKVLAKKGGIPDDVIEKMVSDLGSEKASYWINEMTLGNFNKIKEEINGNIG